MSLTREQGQEVLRRWGDLELDTDDPLVREEFSHWDFDAEGELRRWDDPASIPKLSEAQVAAIIARKRA